MREPRANALRGEALLRVNGQMLRLRPSFSALVAAEAEIGPLLGLIDRAADGGLSLSEITALFWHCLDERPAELSQDRLGDALLESGLSAAMPLLRQIFGQILQGR